MIAALALMVGGCAGDADEAAVVPQLEGQVTARAALGEGGDDAAVPAGDASGRERIAEWRVPVAPPENTPVLFVSAKGAGCPSGTAAAFVASDLQTLTIDFSAFEVVSSKNISRAATSCQLAIGLRDTEHVSYAVSEILKRGYGFLDDGQSARMSLAYHFQGGPLRADVVQREVAGPYDDPFDVQQIIRPESFVWSPCSRDNALNVRVDLDLQSAAGKDGYVNFCALDANCYTRLRLKLEARSCP